MGGQNIGNVPPTPSTPVNIAGAQAAKLVSNNPGILVGFSVNTADPAGKMTLYDGIDNTGTKLGVFDGTTARFVALNYKLSVGLFAVTAGPALDVTIGLR